MDFLYYLHYLFGEGINGVLNKPNWTLIILALFWVSIAVIQDFRKREVANWWNFSFIAVILVYRALVSVYTGDLWYLLWGLIGLAFGFILANVFYYARMFAGGDAKLLMALGAFLPLGNSFSINLSIFVLFIILFIFLGGIYGLVYSLIVLFINFKKFKISFKELFLQYKKQILLFEIIFVVLLFIFLLLRIYLGIFLSLVLLILPLLLLGAKAIENSCLTRFILVSDLTIGDWLVNPVKIGKKTIKPNWEGLSEQELKLINKKFGKNNKFKIEVKYGIPFTPAFLLGIVALFSLVYFI